MYDVLSSSLLLELAAFVAGVGLLLALALLTAPGHDAAAAPKLPAGRPA
jgi:hypothetical protein